MLRRMLQTGSRRASRATADRVHDVPVTRSTTVATAESVFQRCTVRWQRFVAGTQHAVAVANGRRRWSGRRTVLAICRLHQAVHLVDASCAAPRVVFGWKLFVQESLLVSQGVDKRSL
ncbi:hypothetical protein MRX96_046195 [Rhipicephalus microplus]